ncbi:MAG: UvrD-helicase domain-containing protein, partial [Duodenibacillus sp.]
MTEEKHNGFDLKTASLSGRYIIEAGAGTGKTYSLEHLVLRLLIETKATIDRILIVTFTKSATAEIAERVRGMLERISGVLANGGCLEDDVE